MQLSGSNFCCFLCFLNLVFGNVITTAAMTKEKKEKKKSKEDSEPASVVDLAPIARPLAHEKLSKRIFKTIKRGIA
jgi:hypothetical protein